MLDILKLKHESGGNKHASKQGYKNFGLHTPGLAWLTNLRCFQSNISSIFLATPNGTHSNNQGLPLTQKPSP